MFGEYESESPRVPSPWESLISNPCEPPKRSKSTISADTHSTFISSQRLSPSPLLLPRLVPENDTGNVEYKLQLLDPSPARFARLVTQLKWRLLEGGGQAYYELGVADSGELVGLPRVDLESSLDTLEMMAGEIGASVIVVKEIEVPADLVLRYQEDARDIGSWGVTGAKRFQKSKRGPASLSPDDYDSMSASAYTNTEAEDSGTTDCDYEDIQTTIVPQKTALEDPMVYLTETMTVFAMDSEDLGSDTLELDEELGLSPPQYAIDLEISSVYKPRPMRKRFHHIHSSHQHQYLNGQGYTVARLQKKIRKPGVHHYESLLRDGPSASTSKSLTRKQARDKRREERKQALLGTTVHESYSEKSPSESHIISGQNIRGVQVEAETVSEAIEELQASVGLTTIGVQESTVTSLTNTNTNCPASAPIFTTNTTITTRILDPNHDDDRRFRADRGMSISPVEVNTKVHGEEPHTKLIVEVLVVRKMSVEEGYLDFEGFALD